MTTQTLSQKTKKKICFLGASLFTGNMGVTALARSLTQAATDVVGDCEISLVVPNRFSGESTVRINNDCVTVKTVNLRMSLSAKPKEHLAVILCMGIIYHLTPVSAIRRIIANSIPVLKVLSEADSVSDIRGGDSFSDIYGILRMLHRSVLVYVAYLLGKRYTLLPQTYGPFRKTLAKIVARKTFQNADRIYARDRRSVETIHELNKTVDVGVCPDVTFLLKGEKPSRYGFAPPLGKIKDSVLVGVNVSGLLFQGGYTRKNMFKLREDFGSVALGVSRLFLDQFENCELLFLPHTNVERNRVEDDRFACGEVWNRLNHEEKKRAHVLDGEYTESEVRWLIGMCDFFVGSRMHACIAALSQGIPTCGLAYSDKFAGVFETVGMESTVIDLRSHTLANIVEKLNQQFSNRATIKRNLGKISEDIRSGILTTFRNLLL